jgi:hypothetical protein
VCGDRETRAIRQLLNKHGKIHHDGLGDRKDAVGLVRLKGGEDAFDISGGRHFALDQVELQRRRGAPCLRMQPRRERISGVDQHENPLQLWHDFLEQLQPLRNQVDERYGAGQIPAGRRKVVNIAGRDGVEDVDKDDRDLRRGGLGRPY